MHRLYRPGTSPPERLYSVRLSDHVRVKTLLIAYDCL